MKRKPWNVFLNWRFSPTIKRWLVAALILGVFAIPDLMHTSTDLEAARLAVLRAPSSPLPHLVLARLAAFASDWDVARRELGLATSLAEMSNIDSDPQTSPFELALREVNLEQSLRLAVADWQLLLVLQPGYRDAHLRLALLFHRLSDDASAASHFDRAWMLDPNDTNVRAVGRVLGVLSEDSSNRY